MEGPLAESADLRGINTVMLDLMAMSFAREQVKDGADIIGVGDAASSLIGPELYRGVVLEWKSGTSRRSMGWAPWCACTSAATPTPCSLSWPRSRRTSWTWTPWP